MRLKQLFLVLLIARLAVAQTDNFHFTNLSVRDGLSQNSVIRIFQDSKNFMWFCTRDGLNRYDGISFKVYRFSIQDNNSISNSDVTSISENKDGTFWIGTHMGLNFFDPKNEHFKRYFSKPNDKNSLSSSTIKFLLNDKEGRTWIATTLGLDMYNKSKDSFEHIYSNDGVVSLLQRYDGTICFASMKDGLFIYDPELKKLTHYPFANNDFIYCLFEDSQHTLWAGMWFDGLRKFNPQKGEFIQIPLKTKTGKVLIHEQIGYIIENTPGFLMFATRKGLLIYDIKNQIVSQRLTSSNSQLSDEKIIELFKDKNSNIWIGSWNGGVDFYSPYSSYFNLYTPVLQGKQTVGSINSITEINKVIWLATDNGLILYNPANGTYKPLNLNISPVINEIKYIFRDNDKLWISIYAGGLHILNINTLKVEKTLKNFIYGYINAMAKDEAGNYWIGTGTNYPFVMYNPETDKFIRKFPVKNSRNAFAPVNVLDILPEKGQTIWIGTRADGLYRYNFTTKELQHFQAKADSNSLSNNHVSVLFKDQKGRLWVGTFGGGICLMNIKNGTFKTYDHKNGLLNDAVCGIMQDSDGSLWISTLEGLSHFYPDAEKFNNYDNNNGYPIQEIVPNATLKLSNNDFIIGGANGFVLFNPREIVKNPIIPNVVISKFRVWADNVSEGESTSESVFPDKGVRLKYYQAAFTIYFAALNYVYPNKNQYQYRLEGFDKNWNSVKNERSATYTNIPPGDYVFRVKACNNDGVWNTSGTAFEIHILPPPWKTWWAYTIYFLLFVAILSGFIYYILKKQKLETDIKIKQIEQKNLEENHQLRVRLFTNFSHELRTPLTLIIGPLNEILSKEIPDWLRPKLQLIFKNAQRLLWLVNQLMDFRKLEAGFMQLNVSHVDFNVFIDDIIQNFNELAQSKKINFELNNVNKNINTWFDPILIEKVFFNLLSNAFKHTDENGSVRIRIRDINASEMRQYSNSCDLVEGALLIEVEDTGNGIEMHELDKIFEPFYQAHNHEGSNIYGTGIGLNLCKGIIELHSGRIWAESEKGKGSVFKILLPTGNAHYSNEDLSGNKIIEHDRTAIIDLPDVMNNRVQKLTSEEVFKKKENFTVLVVEDHDDVRHYICSLLSDRYKIVEAEDCLKGCVLAEEIVPDLIISDIMTPNMSGIELCNRLKNNNVTDHIPIILLTALSGLDQIKEGLNSLADDYIVKPFNPELLVSRVDNLINIRHKIRNLFNKKNLYRSLSDKLPSADDKFISKVFDYIRDNVDNPDLRIDSFSKDVGMSRVQFYRKIKSITGKTPSTLILEIRMNMAADLIKQSGFNINEIAYRVGFNDSSYFGKCFKSYFGVTPGEYKG